jgi:PKD repeat protein
MRGRFSDFVGEPSFYLRKNNNQMKLIYFIVVLVLIGLNSFNMSARPCSSMASLTPLDTIAFDMSQSVFSTVDGISYIEFPVILRTDDMVINAVDYWFQFDLNKLTYVSTTSTVSTLDVFTNYNTNNQFLSNTSSTTSINVYLPVFVPIMKLKFSLNDPCEEILETDFYAPTTLLNGIVSSYLFIPSTASPETAIQIDSPDPQCPNTDVTFSYASEINGQTITSYAWDFGNGQTGSGQTVVASYSSEGTYTVTLEATTEGGCVHTYTTETTVAPGPLVDFTSAYDGALNQFSFTNLSTISSGSITGFFWEFGDGQTSDLFEPTHVYASEGLYDVTLTATSDLGCEASFTSVIDAPIPVVELKNLNGTITLFPNPANHELNILSTQTMHFFIVDEIGRRVSEEQFIGANQSAVVTVDHLSSGLYSLVGYDKDGITNMRFVVQR